MTWGRTREEVPVELVDAGNALEDGGVDGPRLDARVHDAGAVHEGMDVRLREQLAQCLEHVLTAALGDEPVMDEGDLHGRALYHRWARCRQPGNRAPHSGPRVW